jgi:hypothetical protein
MQIPCAVRVRGDPATTPKFGNEVNTRRDKATPTSLQHFTTFIFIFKSHLQRQGRPTKAKEHP